MSTTLVLDLEHNRKRLQYYSQLKEQKAASKKATALDKWIEIYEERVEKLERKATKLGLKFVLPPAANSSSHTRSA